MTEENNKLLNAALEYLDNGFSVVPVIGKKPCLDEWKIYQTQKPTKEEVENWFHQKEVTGIGIVVGSISGIAVLDTEAGADLSKIIIPKTPTVKTGGGGFHYYFKYPKVGIGNHIRFADLMDIKGEGGIVVAPPSLHLSGNSYEWITNLNETPLANIPDWLEKDLEKKNVSGSDKNWLEKLQGVTEGSRNTSAVSVIGKFLKHFPMSEWESIAWPALIGWNSQNFPPLPKEELRSTFNSISQKESHNKLSEPTGFWNPLALKDVLKMKFPKNPFLVEKLIPEKGITVISGQPGSGKSWITFHIMQCIASKKDVFDKFKTKKGKILLIDGETDFWEIARRLRLMKFRSDREIFICSEQEMKIDQENGLKKIIDCVKKNGIKLVILDPLIALHDSDENTATGMQKVMNGAKKITNAGATVLIIHHHKKNEEGNNPSHHIRGSSAIHGAIDSHIEVKSEDAELEVVQINQGKARRGKKEKPFIVKMEEQNGMTFKFVEYIQRSSNGTQEIKEYIMVILNPERGKELKLIHAEVNQNLKMGVGENKVRTALKELETLGKVKVMKTGHNTFLYFKVGKNPVI